MSEATGTTHALEHPLREALGRWLAWMWAGWLAATVLLAGTRFHPTPAGRTALGLVVLGFAVFTIGRRGRTDGQAHDAAGRAAMALAYYGGYAMMLAAAVLTTAVAIGEWAA
jgi:hypothetical protein